MMTVPMDKAAASPSLGELAQRLWKKNAEHESHLRRSAQSKVPSDPNIWLQMRENYQKIILADHDFSEGHEIEHLLWKIHYKRIEEFRTHIISAGKNNINPDRTKRIRSTFRSFLSEATGFYHDLILKIRSTYGLPFGYFSEGSDSSAVSGKDEKKMVGLKKGMLSCYRCLIYLGDLTRYKGLYGDADYASREYAAASIYYKEAALLCPSNGNPHHQLAILASYSGDEVTAIYRYFRSLAVDNPFSAARENLILAFDKFHTQNHEVYGQLPGNNKIATARSLPSRSVGRGRGRGETKFQPKDPRTEETSKGQDSIPEILKAFYVRFVRLNGILFTRTSLETFGELSATVISDLQILLSFGPHEELNFDVEAAENALSVVKLVAILISTVHNANKDADNQSFAEIVQRRVVLQKAFTTAFEFVGYLLKRCVELHDIASSIYLPAILVFIEWLACHPDFVACSEMDEEQAGARSFFWNQFVPFTNKLILTGLARFDGDDDETCYFDMGTYEGGETGNRLALSEDFELRGFSPLVPAQVILDFSNKRVFGSDGSTKEKKARVERILAAGKVLINFVQIDQLRIYFHSSSKKFLMASEPPCSESAVPHIGSANANTMNHIEQEHVASSTIGSVNLSVVKSKEQYYAEGDDDEEIVFKPSLSEKLLGVPLEKTSRDFLQPVQISDASWSYNGASVTFQSNAPVPTSTTYVQSLPVSSIGWAAEHQVKPSIGTRSIAEFFQPLKTMSGHAWVSTAAPVLGPQDTVHVPSFSNIISDQHMPASTVPGFSNTDNIPILPGQDSFLLNALKNVNISPNGFLDQRMNGLQLMGSMPQICAEAMSNGTKPIIFQCKSAEVTIPSALDSVVPSVVSSAGTSMKSMETPTGVSKATPVSRPGRHAGPPPGFKNAPLK